MRGLGTLLNVAGASAGTLFEDRLPERPRDTLVAAFGLFTLALGVQQALAVLRHRAGTASPLPGQGSTALHPRPRDQRLAVQPG